MVSLRPCLGCAVPWCASCAPTDRLLLDHLVLLRFSGSLVLSVASHNVTSFTASYVRIFIRFPGLKRSPKGATPEIVHSGLLQTAHVSSTMACLMLSRNPSLSVQFFTLALICAVLHTSLESPLAGCTREYASSALRETTFCVSRESSVHHCHSLKAVLSSRLQNSTTVWSTEAFNTTGVVVVRGKTSRVPSLFSFALLRGDQPRIHLNSANTRLHPRAPALTF